MARQLMVQPHFWHFTTQAWGSALENPIMATSIGEEKENMLPFVKLTLRCAEDIG